jgi:UDP-N-acetylglucosamine--N-acetylmuramyl-(pentapeptide) pyrophosphoryl-undecaprenol N-acetylglucosamine transferase
MTRAKILIAAGGSGGHIFPAVALARSLKSKRDCEIKFVGSNKSLDRRIFEKESFRYALLSANKLPYKPSLSIVVFFVKFVLDIFRSFFIITGYRPSAVVGFGGYVSFPVVFAAFILRVPRIIHEQNVVPGRANKVLFTFADKIALTFKETKKYLSPSEAGKSILTGNPIRREVLKDDRPLGIARFGLDKDKFTILVIGGSQGAHFLNKTFVQAVSLLDDKTRSGLQVIHLTGTKDYEPMLRSYQKMGEFAHRVHSFIDGMEEAYSASDLIVTRAGASALFEAAFFGRPMILVPYPFAASHQTENARVFSSSGAAIEIDERSLTPDIFRDAIRGLLGNGKKLKALSEEARRLSMPEAADRLASEVLSFA